MEENNDKNNDPRLKNLEKGTWKEGQSGNPNGRPKGRKNWSTVYWEALEKLAQKNDTTAEEIHLEILQKGILSARKGDYRFYKDVLDREYGRALEKHDITSDGKPLILPAELINKNDINTEPEPNSTGQA